MIGWKRSFRLPARLRRWIATFRAALHRWSRASRRRLLGRILLNVERLEGIEAAGCLLPVTAGLGAAAASVRAAEPPSQTPDLERPSTVTNAAMDAPSEEAQALSDSVFGHVAAQSSSSVDSYDFLAATDQTASSDAAEPKHAANDPALDPVMAASNALVDPASHPDAAPANGDKSGSHHAGAPASDGVNTNPPNLAGAYAGAGHGAGGTSTAFAGGSGPSGGSGAGPAAASLTGPELAAMTAMASNATTLGKEGAFASQVASNGSVANTASAPSIASVAVATPSTPPSPPPAAGMSRVLSPSDDPSSSGSLSGGLSSYQGGPLVLSGSISGGLSGNFQVVYNSSDGTFSSGSVTLSDGPTFTLSSGSASPSYVGNNLSGPFSFSGSASNGGTVSGSGTFSGSVSNPGPPPIYSGTCIGSITVTSPLAWQGPTFSWTQTPAANPSVTTPAAQTNTEGDSVSLQVSASDPNGNPLSYDAVDLPPGLSINSTTGLISGTVQDGAAADFDGSYNPTIIVANNQGGSTTTTFSWTINQAQVAPVLSSPGNQSNLTGDTVSLQVSATQVDNDPISYDDSNLPVGLSIDPDSGLISGTVDPSAATGTPYAVSVTATDDVTNLSASQNFNWTISVSTAPPIWTAPGDQSNAVGDEVDLQLSAGDANGDYLTYTATGLPPGLTLDPIAGIISGTLPNNAGSSTPYTVTVTASNGISSSSQTFAWTVNPISLPNPGDQGNLDGDAVSLPLSATDASNGTLSYSADGLPPGLSIDSGTGEISGTIDNTADTNSPYSVMVTATDGTNTNSQTFNWYVAPLAMNPVDDQESQEGTTVSLQVSATDNVGTPTYSATGLPDGVSINATTGLISGTVGLGSFGSSPYQVTVTATDGANTSSQSFVWTVTPRVPLVNPGLRSNASGDSVSLQVSATSPSGTLSYSATGLPDGLSINSSTGLISGSLADDAVSDTPYTVTVTADDGTSSSSQSFSWTISAINLVAPDDQSNLDGDTVSLSLTTSYHGMGTLSYSADGLPPGVSINSSTGLLSGSIDNTADTDSPYEVTVTVTDGTNTMSQTFYWTINPLVSVDPLDDQSNADGDVVSLQVSVEDALNNTVSYGATGLPPGVSINSTTGLISGTISAGADSGSPYAVTVTASDGTVSASQTFNWNVAAVGLVNPGPLASVDDQVVSLQMQGSSGATYTASVLPSGLSISSTGLISGTLASNADTNSPYIVTVTATLGSDNVSQTFLWMVTPIGLAIVSDQTNTEGDSVSLQLQGLSNGGTLTYSASGLPDGLSLNSTTGLITGTIAPDAAADGPFTVDVAVSNGTVSASQTFYWTVNPVVNLTALDDQSNNEGDNVSLQVTATDTLNNALTYSADGLPSSLSIDSGTGLISGMVSAGDSANGPYVVTVTATDSTYSSSAFFAWNVTHIDDTAPTMTNPGTQTNVAGDSVSLQINASDADGDSLFYSATGLPDGLYIDPFSGIISGTIADDAVSTTPYQVTVAADDGNGQTANQTFTWLVNAPALTDPALPISAVEGQDTGSITVATFTTPDLNAQASDFVATIDWGDGNSDMGMVSGGNGSFTVTDDHTYAQVGNSPYAVNITITDTITGASTTDATTATVTTAPLTATGGFDLGAVQQQSSSLTLATFTSGNPNLTASDFTATIDWGDGSGAVPATVSDSGDGEFSVSGSHTYAQNGTYTATITITGTDGATASTTSTVTVGDVFAGIQSNLTVSSFTDADTSVLASSFTATINWGDGNQSNGTMSGSNGVFTVQGTHTYTQDSIDQAGGVYTVTVTVSDSSSDTLTSSRTVAVVRPPMAANEDEVVGQPGIALSNVPVAEFTEPDAMDGASEFSASIDWGDGSSSSGTIQEVGPGLFEVLGTHTFATASFTPIVVSISQGWQNQEKIKEVVDPKQIVQGNPFDVVITKSNPALSRSPFGILVQGGATLTVSVALPNIPKADIVNVGTWEVIDNLTDTPLPYTKISDAKAEAVAGGGSEIVGTITLPTGLIYTNAYNQNPQILLLMRGGNNLEVQVALVGAVFKDPLRQIEQLTAGSIFFDITTSNRTDETPSSYYIPVEKGDEQLGSLEVAAGEFEGKGGNYTGIYAVFNTVGLSASLQAAVKAFGGAAGDYFTWYQVVTGSSLSSPLYFKSGGEFFPLPVSYVDPTIGDYYERKAGGFVNTSNNINPPYDSQPWYYNVTGTGPKEKQISYYASNSAVGFVDVPNDPPSASISYETWLVLVTPGGKVVAWTGVGFSWIWENAADNPIGDIYLTRELTGQPAANYLPQALWPPKPEQKN
ncbi:MAG TPA: putative Ig domain-containing protein [Gemmataceae bacterium]